MGACCAAITAYLTLEQGIRYLRRAFKISGIFERVKGSVYNYNRAKLVVMSKFLQRLNMRRFIESSIRTVKLMPPQGIIALWNMRREALRSLRGLEERESSSDDAAQEDIEAAQPAQERAPPLDPRIIERMLRTSELVEASADQRPLKNCSILIHNPIVSLSFFIVTLVALAFYSLFFSYNVYPFDL